MENDFRNRFSDLDAPPEDADKSWFLKRGREFEEIVYALLDEERLEPRANYRPSGEEIDGSFSLNDRVFLLETKWHKKRLPASAIYQLKGKVDGKLTGTVGVFISVSGYSESAVEAVRFGKDVNVILFDGDDFRACLRGDVRFTDLLRIKLRRAAETGEVYFPYESEEILSDPKNELVFIVEGRTDKIVISRLASKLLEDRKSNIDYVVAMGKMGVANIANSWSLMGPLKARVVSVVDSDGDVEGTRSLFTSGVEHPRNRLLIVDPSIEAWLFPDSGDPSERLRQFARERGISRRQAVAKRLTDLDIEGLKEKDTTFRDFARLVVERSSET